MAQGLGKEKNSTRFELKAKGKEKKKKVINKVGKIYIIVHDLVREKVWILERERENYILIVFFFYIYNL